MFYKNQIVRCVSNPYSPMVTNPAPGDLGTITRAGDHFVSVKFGKTSYKMWMIVDGNGNKTIEPAK